MPVYEYECKKCLKRFEKIQKIGEDGRNLSCPLCGEKEPKKLISSFSSRTENSCSTSGFS
ncbi:MAG: zinc ribbon domain-containing protein [Candidatus Eremiobacterota bacterium]